MSNEIKREVVSLGLDYRPLPIDVGDGTVWNFSPDPAPKEFNGLVVALRATGKAGQAGDAAEENTEAFREAMEGLSAAIGVLLIEPEQRKQWAKKSYGMATLTALSKMLMEQTTGFTKESAGGSGKG